MNELINNELLIILNSLFPVVGTILMGFITNELLPVIKQHFTKQQLQNAYSLAQIAVKAAEQSGFVNTAQEKKTYVFQYLKSKGLKVTDDDIEKLIEAAVLELKKGLELK